MSSGQPGDGAVERECARVLAGRFIECRTTATYPPQEKSKNGEVRVDVAYFRYDRGAKALRQLHGEGFVNTFTETAPLVFVTGAIENIPAGWHAREQYESRRRCVARDVLARAAGEGARGLLARESHARG